MVAQRALELILMRQLAGYLTTPILLFDAEGNLLFFNRAAEALLGRRFADTGETPWLEWIRLMPLYAEDGSLIPPEERPLPVTLRTHHPVHRRVRLKGPDGGFMHIASTIFPLEGQSGRHLGGVIVFWESPPP